MPYKNPKMAKWAKHEHYLDNLDSYYEKALNWRRENPERKRELNRKSYWKCRGALNEVCRT